jgi:SAM-dependent methyltransferase
MQQDWGKVFVVTRYQPNLPAYTCESLIGLTRFGMRNASPELVQYVEALESLVDQYGIQHNLKRPEMFLRQGDQRDYVYSKTMHKAANMLARRFLKSDCDSICFIDSDAVFGTNALEELRNDTEGYENFDVLQAFTVKRGWPPEPMYLTEQPDQPQSDSRLRGVHLLTNLPLDPDYIYPVDSVSLHFTLIKRWVFEALLEHEGPEYTYWFEYSRDNGEDVTFSTNARKVGAKLGMTTRLKVGHSSEIVTGWDTMVDYYDRKFAYAAGEPPASLERFTHYFEAQRKLADLVAEYTGESPDAVYQKSCVGGLPVLDAWNVAQPKTVDEVHDFYGNTSAYFYDLVKWNASPGYQRVLKQLQGVNGKHVLEIGGGIGTTTEFLAMNGNYVDYYDVPGVLRDFAAWRFKRIEPAFDRMTKAGDEPYRPIQMIEQWEIADEPGRGYDLIVAIDVLEHLHPDEFDFICDGLMMGLNPGGVLFAHNTWHDGNGLYPFHYDHADKWAAFVARHGLKQIKEYSWAKPGEDFETSIGGDDETVLQG